MDADNMVDKMLRKTLLIEGRKVQAANTISNLIQQSIDRLAIEAGKTDWQIARRADQRKFFAEAMRIINPPQVSDNIYDQAMELARYESAVDARIMEQSLKDANKLVEFNVPAPNQVDAAVRSKMMTVRSPQGEMLLKGFIKGNMRKNAQIVLGNMRLGMAMGETTPQIVRRLVQSAGVSRKNATAVVRTAMTAASSAGREKLVEQNSDLIKGVKYVATLDSRTSSECRALDGRVFAPDRGPRPPVHVDCRSTTIPVLRGKLEELSQSGTRMARDAKTGKPVRVPARQTYYQWLKKQDAAFQDSVLGKKGGKLFRSKGMTPEKFAEKSLNKLFQPRSISQIKKLENQVLESPKIKKK